MEDSRKTRPDEPVRPAAAGSPRPEKPDPLAMPKSKTPRMERPVHKDSVRPIPDAPDL